MAERFPGGVISKTPPTVTAPTDGEGGSASGLWSLDEVLGYEKAGAWPKKTLPRELYSWGYNGKGGLGLNDVASRSSPVQVGALNDWKEISIGRPSLAVKTTGTLFSWGRATNGATGLNDTVDRSSPVQVGSLTNWSSVSAGDFFSLAIKTDGTLWAWGKNYRSQLGDGTTSDKSSPIQVGASTDWYQISGGEDFSAAIKSDGSLWTWGLQQYGRLGNGVSAFSSVSVPAQIGALTNWSHVSAGSAQCVAVKTDGTLWAWGRNGSGQLGDNTTQYRSSPVQIGSLTTWSKVSAGDNSGFAIKTDGTLWAWGTNSGATAGQLGLGDAVNKSSPVQVGALTNWSTVSGGKNSTVAIKTDGTLWSWGQNYFGQLGNGTRTNNSSPVQVGALTNWDVVSNNKRDSSCSATTKG